MSSDLVAELLTTVRTGKTELVRQNAYDLLLKLREDEVRGARGAIEAIERSKHYRKQSTLVPFWRGMTFTLTSVPCHT
jgi:hypothetical protein